MKRSFVWQWELSRWQSDYLPLFAGLRYPFITIGKTSRGISVDRSRAEIIQIPSNRFHLKRRSTVSTSSKLSMLVQYLPEAENSPMIQYDKIPSHTKTDSFIVKNTENNLYYFLAITCTQVNHQSGCQDHNSKIMVSAANKWDSI